MPLIADAAEAEILEAGLDGRGIDGGAARDGLGEDVIDGGHVVAHDVDAQRPVARVDALDDLIHLVVGDDGA